MRVVASTLALTIGLATSSAVFAQSTPAAAHAFVFADLSLDAAEAAAAAASPDLAGADARVAQSRAALAAARAGIAPALVSSYAQVPQGNPPGPNIISRQLTTGFQLTVGDFIAYGSAVREAAFTLAATEADRGAALATERVKVVGLYYDALKARAVANARRDALALATSQFRAARLRARAGDAPQLDVLRADVAVAKATADLELATAADTNATEALRGETDAGDAALIATTQSPFIAPESQLTDPAIAVARARAMRPEFRSTKLAIDAARAATRSARAAGFPILTVSGGYLIGTDGSIPVEAPSISAQFTLPLSSANRHRIAIAAAKVTEAQAKAIGVDRRIALDVAASARTLGAAERATFATTRARQSADAERRALELGYRNGASSSLELESARASYAQTVVDELGARYDVEKARATLAIEVGS
jgi:outer membrane protein